MKHFIALLTLTFSLNATEILLPENFTTDFQQIITNDQGKVIKYKGKVFFKNYKQMVAAAGGTSQEYSQSLFKWEYTAPTKKEVCTDGVQLIVVDHDLEQVSHYTIDDGINLEEILKLAKPITTTDYKATYKDVEYLISMDNKQQLQEIVYVDNLDNKVKIIFNNMRYNKGVAETQLECSAPQTYDVIKG